MSPSPIADEYLADVRRAASQLPRGQRRELLAELSAHVETAVAETSTEAELRNVLDALGEPNDIVRSAQPPVAKAGTPRWLPLVIGGVAVLLIPVPLVGVIAGVVALIIGYVTLRRAKREGTSAGYAKVGMALGAIAIVLQIIVVTPIRNVWTTNTDHPPNAPVETTIVGSGG
jgi:hypothetical protein